MMGFIQKENRLIASLASPRQVNAGVFSKSDRKVKFSHQLDSQRRYLTDSPTPARLANLLRAVDNGDIAVLPELQEEMESKDAHLQGVSQTRQLALTALDWDIQPDPRADDQDLAIEASDVVRRILNDIRTFGDTLVHLATGIPNLAVVELIWHKGMLVETVDVPGSRLIGDSMNGPGIFIETEKEPLGVQALPSKFVVYHRKRGGCYPLRVTLTHATVKPWIMGHFSISDWMAFSELYGVPWRIGTIEAGATPEDKDVLEEMLKNMGSDTAAVYDEFSNIEIIQASGTGETFEKQIAWSESKMSILYLGQTLTTDTSGVGSFALGKVHDNVRTDILLSDIKIEADVIREQIIRPMVALLFPAKRVPVPRFVRQLIESQNVEGDRLAIDQISKALELKMPLMVDETYEKLNLTKPEGFDQEVIGAVKEDESEADNESTGND